MRLRTTEVECCRPRNPWNAEMSSLSFDARSVTSMFENNVTTISITLQYGSQKEVVAFERTASPEVFQSFQNRARVFAEKHSAPLGPGIEMHLYQHDYNSVNFLQLLTNLNQLGNGSVVEIIVVDKNEQPTQPHELREAQYMTPTFCDYCGEVLMGLLKQGFKCKRCKCNFHKRCTNAPRNNCAAAGPSTISESSDTASLASSALPHTLSVHSYKVPTVCRVCDGLLVGLVRQGLRCRDCKVNVHKKCATQLPMNCRIADGAITPRFDQLSFNDGVSMASAESIGGAEPETSMLPLGRLPGQASSRYQNRSPTAEGWVVHFVLTEPDRRLRHYWVLSNGVISMYNEYNDGVNPTRVYKQIALSEILAIVLYNGDPIDSKFAPHFFELKTNANVVYCVGENFDAFGGAPPPSKLPRHASTANQGVTNIQAWFQILTRARLPPASRQDHPNAEPSLDFTALYQVLSDNTLGSGQFGTVYAGVHRQTGRGVAVKIIAKDRFQRRPAGVENLKSEVTILKTVSHPGIIRLEAMFESKDKIFVVMEKMNGDMLEMILSQAAGRLNERVTRFLIVQIVSALRYLHAHNVAHCDLKPENVLLSDLSSTFPQTKLCDFGYARFIGDAQFRQTIVGTPAYLAPEVLQRKGYNRSLDMWSVGVIIYVTLSGTFPFNDGEEVADQIQNAEFMFPQDPWGQISPQAIDLIQKLLRLRIDERLTIEQCFAHEWLDNYELFSDLQNLERRLGFGRYLTTDADEQKYASMQIG